MGHEGQRMAAPPTSAARICSRRSYGFAARGVEWDTDDDIVLLENQEPDVATVVNMGQKARACENVR
jgi:hypothetical protein